MLKYLALTFISIGCVLADGAANTTDTDQFSDPYEQMKTVDKLLRETISLDKELADLTVKKDAAKKTKTDLETEKADLKTKLEALETKKTKSRTDADELAKVMKEISTEQAKLDKVSDDITAAADALAEVSGKVRDKQAEVNDHTLKIATAQKSIGNDPTTDEVLQLLTNGVGSLFKVPEVVKDSSYASFDLWDANLKACEKYWGQLKVKDETEANKTSSASKDIYADRVKADDAAIKACKDFETFVSESILKPWKKKATDESKTEAEVTLDDFPVEEFRSAEAQYIHDFLIATDMQATTMLQLKKSDAPTKAKLEAVLEEMKEYKSQAKDELKDANTAEEAANSSSAWIWIVVGVIAAIVILVSIWKCYCSKPEEK